jgi:hypothetical protein
MTIATGSPATRLELVRIRRYVAPTDGLKDGAPIAPGERRHHSSVEGVVTGMKLIGRHPRNYRDWVLEGSFEMTDVATGVRTQGTRMYNRGRKFFLSVRDLLETGKAVGFSYDFYVERRQSGGGLKTRLEVTRLSALDASELRNLLQRLSPFSIRWARSDG